MPEEKIYYDTLGQIFLTIKSRQKQTGLAATTRTPLQRLLVRQRLIAL